MSLVLESKAGGDFKPHVEGIYPAVCVDVIDLGLVEMEFQGERRLVNRVRVFFETEQKNEEGKNCIISRTMTSSLHPKARLAEFLSKWRGRPIVPGESIDLAKLIGASCTLMISHQQNMVGRKYASIDAVSKPTKRVVASGGYDPVAARERIAEWKAKDQAQPGHNGAAVANRSNGTDGTNVHGQTAPPSPGGYGGQAKSGAPGPAPLTAPEPHQAPPFDPEVGF